MLEIEMECKRGILFIRLRGELTKKTKAKMHKEVTELIGENKIRNVVFNIQFLSKIDSEGILELYKSYQYCLQEEGLTLLCFENSKISKQLRENSLLQLIHKVPNEYSAFAYL